MPLMPAPPTPTKCTRLTLCCTGAADHDIGLRIPLCHVFDERKTFGLNARLRVGRAQSADMLLPRLMRHPRTRARIDQCERERHAFVERDSAETSTDDQKHQWARACAKALFRWSQSGDVRAKRRANPRDLA